MWRRAAAAWVVLGLAVGVGVLGGGPAWASQATTTSVGLRADPGMEETADLPATRLPEADSGSTGTAATPAPSSAGGAAPGDVQGSASDLFSTDQRSGESQSPVQLLLGVGMTIIGGTMWLVRRNRRRASVDLLA